MSITLTAWVRFYAKDRAEQKKAEPLAFCTQAPLLVSPWLLLGIRTHSPGQMRTAEQELVAQNARGAMIHGLAVCLHWTFQQVACADKICLRVFCLCSMVGAILAPASARMVELPEFREWLQIIVAGRASTG